MSIEIHVIREMDNRSWAYHTKDSIDRFPAQLEYLGYCYINGELVHFYN